MPCIRPCFMITSKDGYRLGENQCPADATVRKFWRFGIRDQAITGSSTLKYHTFVITKYYESLAT